MNPTNSKHSLWIRPLFAKCASFYLICCCLELFFLLLALLFPKWEMKNNKSVPEKWSKITRFFFFLDYRLLFNWIVDWIFFNFWFFAMMMMDFNTILFNSLNSKIWIWINENYFANQFRCCWFDLRFILIFILFFSKKNK